MENKNFKEETDKYIEHSKEFFSLATDEMLKKGEEITKQGQAMLKDVIAVMDKYFENSDWYIKDEKDVK